MCYEWPALHTVFSDSRLWWQGPKTLERLTLVFQCTYVVANPPCGGLLTHEQKVQQSNMIHTPLHCCFVKFSLPFVVGVQGVDCGDMRGS